MRRSAVRIEEHLKRYVIQWQSWLMSKTGKYISQGRAAVLACIITHILLDKIPSEVREGAIAEFLEALAREVAKFAEGFAEGELEEFDYEGFLAEIFGD